MEGNVNSSEYSWREIISELKVRFLEYENSQYQLIQLLRESGIDNGLEDKNIDGEKIELKEIDPFTAWSLILKYGDVRKSEILENLKKILSLKSSVPNNFDGVPVVNAQKAWYFPYKFERDSQHISSLWILFKQAIKGDIDSALFDNLLSFKLLGMAKLTFGLFLIDPENFLPLNAQTKKLVEKNGIDINVKNYQEYFKLLSELSKKRKESPMYMTSHEAYEIYKNNKEGFSVFDENVNDDLILTSSTKINNDSISNIDLLRRNEFSFYLANEINDLMKKSMCSKDVENKSFVFNVYGKWGAGKSTFVNMLKDNLLKSSIDIKGEEKKWVSVDFNAWRNQHVKPIWWSLLENITRQTIEQESNFIKRNFLKTKEWVWKIKAAYGFWIFLPVLIGAVFINFDQNIEKLAEWKNLIGVMTSIVTVFGLCVVAMQAIFSGEGISKLFQTLHRDPYEYVITHYKDMLRNLNGKPIFVFIDDLDRCDARYVVELLEYLHTFFSDKQVLFMVAADRSWISSCFENVNENSKKEIGSSRGYLFLEKIFQVSFGLPVITPDIKNSFVQGMLGNDLSSMNNHSQSDLESIESILQEAANEDELTKKGETLLNQGFSAAKIAEVATKISSSEKFRTARKHRLMNFLPLIDANPRNIILLINVYGIYINLFRMGGRVEFNSEVLDQLALWSILNIRFPILSEFIESDLDSLDLIYAFYESDGLDSTGSEKIPENIRLTLSSRDVRDILIGCKGHEDFVLSGLNKSVLNKIFN